MGGNKSKPLVDSARQVLSKRVEEEAAAMYSHKTIAIPSIDFRINIFYNERALQRQEESHRSKDNSADFGGNDLDRIKEVANRTMVNSSTEGTQTLFRRPNSPTSEEVVSAALLRINEEKAADAREREAFLSSTSSIKKKTKVLGRLTEERLMAMFCKFRDDPEYTVEKAAEEFELPLVTVQAMADSTRSAVVYKNIKDSHLWIAK
mmetsp:Transcript_69081/g.135612  ORF Transcript_69081/g.135612 Transcript_69081/m.135612 type:complete len:206 (+) Transcript_69081:50-667(+)